MAAYLERRPTRAAGWSRRFAGFAAVLFLTSGMAHRFGWLETVAFLWVLCIIGLLAAAALILACYVFSRLWNFGDLGGGDLTVGAVIALAVLTPFLISGYRAFVYPRLGDISTDLDSPPMLAVASRSRGADMNPVGVFTPQQRKLQMDSYPLVTGRRYELPFDRTAEAINAVLQRQGWVLATPSPVAVGPAEITVEALARTFLLGFPVDVAVRLTDEDNSTYVDMRSASRYGDHDLGDNARRITTFLTELDAEIAALTGAAPAE